MKTLDELMALADKYAESDVDFVLLGDPDPKPFRDALQSAIEALQRDLEHMRMERARGILTDNNPKSDHNWAMLDTIAARALLNQKE